MDLDLDGNDFTGEKDLEEGISSSIIRKANKNEIDKTIQNQF